MLDLLTRRLQSEKESSGAAAAAPSTADASAAGGMKVYIKTSMQEKRDEIIAAGSDTVQALKEKVRGICTCFGYGSSPPRA